MDIEICRLCMQDKQSDETILIDIFGALINKEGDKFCDKINLISGIKVSKNDGLPSFVCHKCLVFMDNFIDFRNQIAANDEKLRIMFNIRNGTSEIEEDDMEIVSLDPNKNYESSEEDQFEPEQNLPLEISKPPEQKKKVHHSEPKAKSEMIRKEGKKEIYHCKYCDIVFSDAITCFNHETFSHDPQNPFECLICKLKVNTHPSLIIHIKNEHKSEKPYLCVQCTKTFVRRSDLRKHVFVHAGIRLFTCDQCSKSFTRSTNLAKHKKTHEEAKKNYRCMLCPKAFQSNVLLSQHMEVHMSRNTFNCKFCNLVFTQREELEQHQKTHIAPPQIPQMNQIQQPQSLGFYSQIQHLPSPPRPQIIDERPPMNFFNQEQSQLKNDYPIMNQLLSTFKPYKCDRCIESFSSFQQLQNHQQLYHAKNFSCSICNLSYYKKKELDRHISSQHTDIRFNCSKCTKSFTRKDKLLRHEKIHLAPPFYNCSMCTAVFLKKPLLDVHMKIHEIPIVNPLAPLILPDAVKELPQLIKLPSPPEEYPMNLSMNKEMQPIDLSNEKNKIIIESDDDDLKIIENNFETSLKPNGSFTMLYPSKTDTFMTDAFLSGFLPSRDLHVTASRIEPTKDLPMEILQSPDL